MADDIAITAGTGTTVATDDIGGRHFQRVKPTLGADGTAVDVSAGAGAVGTGVQRVTLGSDDPAVVALQILDNAIAGSEMQVDVVAALPAGANNIGDVDVLSVVPGTGATALGKAEDAAHTTGDVGVMLLGVRNDAGTTLAGTDGDYIPPSFDANGALRVTGGGGGTEYTEDVAAAADPVGQMLVAVRRDTLSASEVSADGDNVALKANSLGQLHTSGSYKEDDAHASGDWGKVALFRRIDAAASSAATSGDYAVPNLDANGKLWIRDTELVTAITDAAAAVIPAGENHLGAFGSSGAVLDVTLSLDTSAYADGDVMATTQEIASFMRVNAGRARIESINVSDIDDQGQAFDIIFLNANSSLGAENAAPDIDDTEVLDIIGRVRVGTGDYIDLGANRVATLTNVGLYLKAAAATTSIWIGTIIRGAATYTASGVKLKIGVTWD